MITTRDGMDPHSLAIKRDGQWIGDIQWHPEREPRIVIAESFGHLTLVEIETIIQQYQDYRKTHERSPA